MTKLISIKLLALCLLFIGLSFPSLAQTDYLIGYKNKIAGKNFVYHSIGSNNTKAMLIRANKHYEPIEWETEVVPEHYKQKTVSFIWEYGIDVRPQNQKFDLFVNGQKVVQFANPSSNDQMIWKTEGEKGIVLSFKQAMVDRHGDQMGYAVLTLPTKLVGTGKAARIKIDGVDNQSEAWYMTFEISLESSFKAQQLQTVAKKEGQLFHTIRFNYVHLGDPQKVKIGIDDKSKTETLVTGLNEIDFMVPKVDQPTTVNASFEIGNIKQEKKILLKPVKEWTVYLVQHSHTDIGYTRAQSEILAEHLRYIDYALDYCDQTDNYPPEAQFRWTCEATWMVREYLNSRPKSQVDRLLQRIKEGRIEVTGMFFNYSEIVDETALAIQLQPIKQMKEKGINVTTAMQNDVNGIGWCMVDHYHNTGVKYLIMGQHGHRARIPFDKPTPFWWESPSGNKLLAYRTEHYMHGNTLSLTSGQIDVFRDNLSSYLLNLEAKEYPFDRISFQFSGYITDNSPPSTKACDIVAEWNKKYEWPKLKLAVASEYMTYLEQNHADALETKKVAWPDWWTDGFGTAMNETKTSRNTQTQMNATMSLFTMAQASGAHISEQIHNEIAGCYDNILFYTEHTFGADESISNPTGQNSKDQWSQKSAYVWMANQQANLLREKAIGLIQPYIDIPKEPSITVFNTLNWSRSGIVEAFIYHDILPLDKDYIITDAQGNHVPAQIIKSRSEGSYWALWVKDVPAMGYTTLNIKVLNKEITPKSTNLVLQQMIENDFYKIQIDPKQNGIISIYDKALQEELIDPTSTYQLGSFIYEKVAHRGELERLTHNLRDTTYKPINREFFPLTQFKIERIIEGELWTSIQYHGMNECADENGVHIEIRLHKHSKEIEFLYRLNKRSNIDPEAIYIAFPFAKGTQDQLFFEAQGGIVRPGIDQLEGTASDWNTIQNFAAVRGPNSQIIFCSNDIPLVQFGAINTGRFYYRYQPQTAYIYSWVLNNYWTTNFKADQSGEISWRYQITSTSDQSNTAATKYGVGNRIPMITRTNSGDQTESAQETQSFIDLKTDDNLLLVSSRPTEHGGIILHLRETEGKQAAIDFTKLLQNPNVKAVYEVNAIGEKQKELSSSLLVESFGVKFVLLEITKD
jgi:hypothetical protein